MADEQKDAWDATQWHEVKKGETLWKIAQESGPADAAAWTSCPRPSSFRPR